MNMPSKRNVTNLYIPLGTAAAVIVSLFAFYIQISSTLDTKFSALSTQQTKLRQEVTAEVRIIREAILREHPTAKLPQPKRN